MLDDYDLRILEKWQSAGDIGPVEMSQAVHLSASQCSRRMQHLRRSGYVAGVFARLAPERLGLELSAYVLVTLKTHDPGVLADFYRQVQRMDEVVECQRLTGSADVILRVATRNLASFNAFLTNTLLAAPEVATAHSSIVLEDVKSTTCLPLEFAARK